MSKKALIIGLQKSGMAAYNLLKIDGYEITITINNELSEQERILLKGVRVDENGHDMSLVNEAWDVVVKNPGIPYKIPFIKALQEKGYFILTEIELAYQYYPNNTYLALTGTNGKTTTTTLLAKILEVAYDNVICAGNIGIPLAQALLDNPKESIVVLELSSFQLMGIEKFKPKIASILNLAPDHLDYMESLEAYYLSKQSIYQNQDSSDYFVVNEDDELVKHYLTHLKAKTIGFSLTSESDVYSKNKWLYFKDEAILDIDKIKIVGSHNLYNIMVALIYAKLMNVTNEIIQDVIYNFEGVEYRLERVRGQKNNVYYNDSKSTTPDSTITALNAFDKEELTLIMGGFDKGLVLSELEEIIEKKEGIANVLLYGANRDKFKINGKNVLLFETLAEVIAYVLDNIDNQIILFSPATSSFDQYKNYEIRGKHFNKLIKGD